MKAPHLRYKHQNRRERTWTIHLISLEKAVKGTVLLAVAAKLLTLFNRDVHAWAEDFVTRHGIDIANQYVHSFLERLTGVGNRQIVQLSVLAVVYAGLLFIESIGLWLQKRWAEYLTAIATALFIPIEIYEIYERFTWVRVGLLVINIFIVWYLITRLHDEKKEAVDDSSPNAPPQIKICGITNLDDALAAVEYGADQLGFNFYTGSSRYISPENARAIVDHLPDSVLKVGVFVNESITNIVSAVETAGLDAVQLHGDEDTAFIAELREKRPLMVIKALRISPNFDARTAGKSGADAVLLDSYSSKRRGGTGKTFSWRIAKKVKRSFPHIYLAGGLSPENVRDGIKKVKPYAVDVCSRIEAEPGKKDIERLRAFILAAKRPI